MQDTEVLSAPGPHEINWSALRPPKFWMTLALSLATSACGTGSMGAPSGPAYSETGQDPSSDSGGTGAGGNTSAPMSSRDLAPARVRRLSADELHNSIRDVFFPGEDARVGRLNEGEGAGFDNRYDDLTVYLELYTSLDALAQNVAAQVAKDLSRILPCGASAAEKAACAATFVREYGQRVYRRPLSDAEQQRLQSLYAAAQPSHEEGIVAMTQAMLLSPHFLFRTELGSSRDAAQTTALTSYERASALSYYLWRSTPDDALLAAAANDGLLSETTMRAQVTRMLGDARAKQALREFFLRWLEIDPTRVAKADERYTPALAESMQRETELFVDDLLFSGDRRLSSLWLSRRSFVEAGLAELYGLTAPSQPDVHAAATLPQAERSGVLTQASFIASHTPADEFSPIFLGGLIRRNVLCQQLLDPPESVPEAPDTPGLSVRDRLTEHQANPACATCHELMDPIGFAFERYSPSGQFAPNPETRALTGEGELVKTDVPGALFGAVELSQRLAESDQVRRCFVANVLQYLLGRETSYETGRTRADVATIDALLSGAFTDDDMLAAFSEVVLSEPFFLRDASDLPTP